MTTGNLSRITILLVSLLALTARPVRAQTDPREELKAIAERVQQQLAEIDRLLLESSDKQKERATPRKLLAESVQRSAEVQKGIEELIEKLNDLKNQSDQQQQQQDQQQDQNRNQNDQQQQQQQQQQGGQQNRNETSSPDFVQQPRQGEPQPQPEPGQQQQQPGPGQQPQDGKEQPAKAEQRPGDKAPEGETGPGSPGEGTESWGELQPYLNALKNRGSPPRVPAKYQKYWKAWLESHKKSGGDR